MAVESSTDRAYFFDTDDFGTEATFTSPALGAVNGIFDEETVEVEMGGEVSILAAQPVLNCRTTDITGVTEGAAVTINSVEYTVKNRMDDGTGVTTLHLGETTRLHVPAQAAPDDAVLDSNGNVVRGTE